MRKLMTLCAVMCILTLVVAVSAQSDELWTSFYGGADGYCGSTTASGDVFDCGAYTAASNLYAFGEVLEVCYNGCVDVVVNDRCGACGLDLSPVAADAIGITADGPAVTEVTPL